MPRTARASVGDMAYHVINRGNARAEVFHKDADFAAFVSLMHDAHRRRPMRVLGYCVMPNHFHLVVAFRGRPAQPLDAMATRTGPPLGVGGFEWNYHAAETVTDLARHRLN